MQAAKGTGFYFPFQCDAVYNCSPKQAKKTLTKKNSDHGNQCG